MIGQKTVYKEYEKAKCLKEPIRDKENDWGVEGTNNFM
jgi:hypothetical protein